MLLFRCFGLRICYTRFSRSFSTERVMAPKPIMSEFSFNHYDVIGFDLDHTICKYKLNSLFNLIYASLASFFCKKYNYPESLLEKHPHEQHFIQKGIVLDKARGNFLKLDQNHRIIKAYHGTCLMPDDQICDIYGNEKIWKDSLGIPEKLCSNAALDQPFYVFKDYFVTPGILVCAKIVDYLDQQNKGPLPSYSFWKQFLEGLFFMYERKNFKTDEGHVFPMLKKNPHLYLEPCSPQVLTWLKEIRKTKKTFLITSANSDSASFVANYCIGPDWPNYFDVIVTFARKPSFFTKICPFYAVENDREGLEVTVDQIKPHTLYLQGNWKHLWDYFQENSGVTENKALYIGDSVVEDIYASVNFAGCDSIAIVEEMLAEGTKTSDFDEAKLLRSDQWGSFFFTEEKNKQNLTFWASMLQRNSKLIVPNLKALTSLTVSDKVSSFSVDCPHGGYFPSVPLSLNR